MPARSAIGCRVKGSGASPHNITGEGFQGPARDAPPAELRAGGFGVAERLTLGLGHTEHAHVRRLGEARVAAGGLAELLAGPGRVEQVVGDLEREADLATVRREHRRQVAAGARGEAAHETTRFDERAGLAPVDTDQLGQAELAAFRLEIEPLAPPHPADAARLEKNLRP